MWKMICKKCPNYRRVLELTTDKAGNETIKHAGKCGERYVPRKGRCDNPILFRKFSLA